MGKSRHPKKRATRDPNVNDSVENQDAPRQYKQLQRLLARPAPEKQTVTKPVEMDVESVYKKQALIARKLTKKFAKRKEYMTSKKGKKKATEDEEETKTDKVRFGEVVQAPPIISVLPKNKAYMPGQKPAFKMPTLPVIKKDTERSESEKEEKHVEEKVGIGRKRKLRDLPESERVALLKERQMMIDAYRAKRK
jgi:hypothetical protein